MTTSSSLSLSLSEIKTFLLAGKCIFTLTSKKSLKSFTYKINKGKKINSPHFVSVFRGGDNNNSQNYSYMGCIWEKRTYKHNIKPNAQVRIGAPSEMLFSWAWNKIVNNEDDSFNRQAEIVPSNRCCKCGRTLTVPSSVFLQMGPECQRKMEE